jgi:putative ABC transport system ATP-binding protein
MMMAVRKLGFEASGGEPVLSFGSDHCQPIPIDRRDRELLPHPGHRPGVATVVLLEDVGRRYQIGTNVVDALQHINLEIDEGEFAVVLGPSGSGKSTLLNIIGALDVATLGRVTVAGRDLSGASRAELFRFRREIVSFVFQTFNLFPTLTALENVQCGAEITRRAADARRRAVDVLGQVGLADRLHHYPSELSGGEQQRVAIARALGTGNPLLLADEPTGDLDFRTGVQILELLRGQAEAGHTVVVVTTTGRSLASPIASSSSAAAPS